MPGFRKTRRRFRGGDWKKTPTRTRRTPKRTPTPRTPTPPENKPRRSTFLQRMARRKTRTGYGSRRKKRRRRTRR